jgi:PAS domain S-box-containing protein
LSRLTLALGLALLVVEAAVAVALIATSDHDTSKWTNTALALTAGIAFVVSGLVALVRRPENSTGMYMAAVGYVWFLGALTESNNQWVFVVGMLVGSVVWGPLAALALVYPTGRFASRLESTIPWIVVAAGSAVTLSVVLVDPTPMSSCDACPANPLNVVDAPRLGDAFDTIGTLVGVALALLVGYFLVRRLRDATPALRRTMWPVLVALAVFLAAIVISGVADALVSGAADALSPVFLAAFAAIPVASLVGVLRTKLTRSSGTNLMLALERGTALRDALADVLGDPTVEIVYRRPGAAEWVDTEGNHVTEPTATPERAVTRIERAGLPVAALLHDPALDESRDLVEGVTAAAGIAIQNGRLHAELRAEARLVQTLTDTMPSLLVDVDLDGRIVKLNLATLDASGYDDPAEVRGQSFWDVFIDPSERDVVIQRFADAAPDHQPAEYVNRFVNVRGEERVIYWRSAPVLDDDGKVVSIVAGGLDITERERLADEKEREHAFLNAIANNVPSLLCVIDENGRITERGANRTFQKRLGWTPEEIEGQVFWERYVVPEDADEVRLVLERVAAGEEVDDHDHHWVTASGERLLIAWTCVPLPNLDDRTLFLVRGVDVTERKRREEAIRVGEERFRAVIESAPLAIMEIGLDDRVRLWNPAAEQIFGWSADEVLGKAPLTIPEDRQEEFRWLSAHEAAGQGYAGFETVRMHRDGRPIDVELSAAPLRDASGEVVGTMAVLSDITDRKRQEEELRASRARILEAEDRARRRLERNLHDGAQQRLVAISVALRLAESKLLDRPEEAATLVRGSRDELALALDELRELARGIHPAVLTDRGLRPALEALVGRSAIPVELETPDERVAPAVEAAAYYVVAEALTNVVKYGGASSALVSVARDDGRLTVTVADDGVGGADPAMGSGLRGLADRVAALDGVLSVDSPSGAGTRVRAEIPLPKPSEPE